MREGSECDGIIASPSHLRHGGETQAGNRASAGGEGNSAGRGDAGGGARRNSPCTLGNILIINSLKCQATLAALDAMRKAHQSEVQREVARFKAEFLRQVQRGEHMRGVDGVKLKE